MKKLMIAMLVSGGLSIPTIASADHVVGKTFTGPDARGQCERFVAQSRNEGRAAAKERERNPGEFNRHFNVRCQENADGSFTVVPDQA